MILFIDLFCGAGGVSTGIEKAMVFGRKAAKVIACVNHDPLAIESHARNHKKALHFVEDIRTLDLDPLVKLVSYYRAKFPHAIICMWASMECTNFSKAKGGLPREADSRTLAEHLYRYEEAIGFDMIFCENVVEFMSWGPLDGNGKPISKRNGLDYLNWVEHIKGFGFRFDHKVMNSADYGAYTSRERWFCQFAKGDLPIVWPEATHAKKPSINGMFGNLKPWKPVREVLDFADEGQSIFGRKKPLVEKTLLRIHAGLKKYVATGDSAFIAKYLSNCPKTGASTGANVNAPCPTVTTQNRLALVQSNFLTQSNGGLPSAKVYPVNAPARVVCTSDNQQLVSCFMTKYHGTALATSVDTAASTLTTKDRLGLVQAHWMDKRYSGKHNHSSVESPAGTVMTNDHHALMTAQGWIMATNFDNIGRSLEEPCPTLLASRKHHYLVNPQFNNKGNSVDSPSPTLIAGMGKRPLSLVSCTTGLLDSEQSHLAVTEEGYLAIVVHESDSPTMRSIKEFMALHGIFDIKMRMLKVNELKLIQGFPKNYYLAGNQTDQKKFIGNSVVPGVVKAWIECCALALSKMKELELLAA